MEPSQFQCGRTSSGPRGQLPPAIPSLRGDWSSFGADVVSNAFTPTTRQLRQRLLRTPPPLLLFADPSFMVLCSTVA
eukprot:COSAG02_NODE_3798_length_6216_cov_2.899951_2_plen_77_part_00